MSETQNHWASYFCNVNHNLASIFLNIGLGSTVPLASQPWLLYVWVYFQSPRPDGLSSEDESPTLFALEDALTGCLAASCGAQLSGRITTQGRREFYFYGTTADGFEAAVRSAVDSFEGYQCDTGSQLDAEWRQFLDVLYPPPEQLQRIANAEVLESLSGIGDIHSIARQVDHFLYFSTDAGRSLFCQAAVQDGFEVADRSENDGVLPFGVHLQRVHSVEQETIDTVVLNLVRLAERFGGEYDGWGCTATSD